MIECERSVYDNGIIDTRYDWCGYIMAMFKDGFEYRLNYDGGLIHDACTYIDNNGIRVPDSMREYKILDYDKDDLIDYFKYIVKKHLKWFYRLPFMLIDFEYYVDIQFNDYILRYVTDLKTDSIERQFVCNYLEDPIRYEVDDESDDQIILPVGVKATINGTEVTVVENVNTDGYILDRIKYHKIPFANVYTVRVEAGEDSYNLPRVHYKDLMVIE